MESSVVNFSHLLIGSCAPSTLPSHPAVSEWAWCASPFAPGHTVPSDTDPPGMSVAASGCAAGLQRELTRTEWSEGISWYCNADQMNVCGIENQSQDLFQCSGSEIGTSLLQRKENTSSIVLRHPGTWSEKKQELFFEANCKNRITAAFMS